MSLPLLLLCNGVDLAEAKAHREPWGSRTVPHWVGNDSFNGGKNKKVLFLYFLSSLRLNFLVYFLFSLPSPPVSTCIQHRLHVTHLVALRFRPVFIYITGGLDVRRSHCEQAKWDNSHLCSYLGRIQRGKVLTGFVGGCCISCIHFPCPAEMSLGYVPDYSVFCVVIGRSSMV